MHIHLGAALGATAFLHVILIGTIWRVIAMRLAVSPSGVLSAVGKAMGFMY